MRSGGYKRHILKKQKKTGLILHLLYLWTFSVIQIIQGGLNQGQLVVGTFLLSSKGLLQNAVLLLRMFSLAEMTPKGSFFFSEYRKFPLETRQTLYSCCYITISKFKLPILMSYLFHSHPLVYFKAVKSVWSCEMWLPPQCPSLLVTFQLLAAHSAGIQSRAVNSARQH